MQTNRGDVQVRITVSGGKITNVTAITYPNETSQSQTISAQVIPTFQSEAVKSQNADIQLVSGATETYTGFKGSLQDAINQTMSGSSTSSTQGQS
ncbi:FMN-binding protein [Bifidobacterium aquikefiri]|uniref:FMN-binding protein n=1 Tax=Bifidobacterium aquikefiri TaxID=1653207 RepID=UPI001FCE8A9E|nr:FMN-binding protein [Bifidobacterium aquikefiri]